MELKGVTKSQKQILELLLNYNIIKDFYLAGGTALSVLFQHRTSVDFDFFSQSLNVNKLKLDINALVNDNDMSIKIWEEKKDTFICLLNNVKVSFFKYHYPLIRPLIKREQLVIASVEDILTMKVIAVIQRGDKKDFFDLWSLKG